MRRKKPVQLNMFNSINQDIEKIILNEFAEYANKIISSGLNSICMSWWRSRYHDYIYSHKNTDYQFRSKAEKHWIVVWHHIKGFLEV